MQVILFVHVRGGGDVFGNPISSAAPGVTVGLVVVALKGNLTHFLVVYIVRFLHRDNSVSIDTSTFKAIKETRQPTPAMSEV